MKHLYHDIARLTPNQWMTLIGLLVLLNMVVMGGLLWIIATDVSPEAASFKQVVMAQAQHTRTPYPTFTPVPTRPPTGTPVPQPSATNTLVPTWTPSVTPTPPPTNTPTVTPTPPPTSAPPPAPKQAAAAPTPTPSPTPTPNVDFAATLRRLKPCENQGKHHIFVRVVDQAGNGLPGMNVKVWWPGGEATLVTGTKIEDPGLTDFAMFKGTYYVEMVGPLSDVVGPISPNIARDEPCPDTGNPVANSLFHYSFEVVFTKVR